MSCVLNVLHGGTKQGKAYAAAYALLTRAQVLLAHVIVPYADLTRTIFSTSPQFRLTRRNFYMQESKQWLAKSSSGRWRRGRRGRRWWRSTTSRSSPSTKLTTFFDSTLAESTGMAGEFLFGRHGQLLAKAPLAYAQLTRRLRGPYAENMGKPSILYNARQPEIDTKTMQVCWTERQEGYRGPRKIKNPFGHVRLGCIIHTTT